MLAVLRLPGVRSVFAFSCLGRVHLGALSLLLILHTHDLTGSFARGGVVAGAYTLGLGASNPVLARIVDRTGQGLMLRTGALLSAAGTVVLVSLPAGTSTGALAACALLVGAAQPPVGACMRALWPQLTPPELRHAALSLEGVVNEIVYIVGPVLIVGGIGAWSVPGALLACGIVALAGNILFSLHPASRAWRPPPTAERHLAGALRGGGVRVLMAVFALCGLGVGAVEVAVPATLEPLGDEDLTGPLLGLWGVGSLVGGVAIARAGAAANPPRRLAWLLIVWGAAHAALALAGGPVTLGLLLFLAGIAIAPTIVDSNGMLDALAPAGTLTEAFTWTTAGLTAGIAVGAALAGALVESASPALALAVLGSGGVLAGLLVLAAAAGPLRAAVPVGR
jgi:MFS family permease